MKTISDKYSLEDLNSNGKSRSDLRLMSQSSHAMGSGQLLADTKSRS